MPNLTLINSAVGVASKISEKRRSPRVACEINLYDDLNHHFVAKNLSTCGLRMCSGQRPETTILPLTLIIPGQSKKVKFSADVVWLKECREERNHWEFGAKISEASFSDQLRLQYITHGLSEGKALASLEFIPFRFLDGADHQNKIVNSIDSHVLSELILKYSVKCNKICPRPEFLWKWCYEGLVSTTLSSVSPKWRDTVINLKLFSIIFFTTIDDIADHRKDREFLDEVLTFVFRQAPAGRSSVRREHPKEIKFLSEMWNLLDNYVQLFPRYSELRDLFYYDYDTLIHSIKYAMLINKQPHVISDEEERIQQAYGVHIVPNATFDLMCSETLDLEEIGRIRDIAWRGQYMCRIANWLATWEREIREGDLTSGIVALALKNKLLRPSELEFIQSSSDVIEKLKKSDMEGHLLALWEKYWSDIDQRRSSVNSIDVSSYLKGMEHFFEIVMASKKII